MRRLPLLSLLLSSTAFAQTQPAQVGITPNTTPEVVQVLDKTNTWVPIGTVDAVNHLFTGTTSKDLGWTDPRNYGAKCDGLADDTTGVQNAFNALVAKGVLYLPPNCRITGPIAYGTTLGVPAPADVTVTATGVLTYDGSSTTANVLTLGGDNFTLGCNLPNWTISGLKLRSTKVMTAGTALTLKMTCNLKINELNVGGQRGDDNANWYNAVRVWGGSAPHMNNAFMLGTHVGLEVGGNTWQPLIDPVFRNIVITGGGVGLHLSGGNGGTFVVNGDVIGNRTNVLISQRGTATTVATNAASTSGTNTLSFASTFTIRQGAIVSDLTNPAAIGPGNYVNGGTTGDGAGSVILKENLLANVGSGDTIQFNYPNSGITFGPALYIDATSSSKPDPGFGQPGVGLEIEDVGSGVSVATGEINSAARISFAQKQCVLIDGTVRYYRMYFSGTPIGLCGQDATGTLGLAAFENHATDPRVTTTVIGSHFSYTQPGDSSRDIWNDPAANPIQLEGVLFSSTAGSISGPVVGTALGNTGRNLMWGGQQIFTNPADTLGLNIRADASTGLFVNGQFNITDTSSGDYFGVSLEKPVAGMARLYHYNGTLGHVLPIDVQGPYGGLETLSVNQAPVRTHVANLAGLKAVVVSSGNSAVYAGWTIERDGATTTGDGFNATYVYSVSACSLNSGAGDDILQVQPTTGGGCWNASLLNTASYVVGNLPTCNAARTGAMTRVTNASAAPTYWGTLTGGGTVNAPVFCDGAAWRYH